MKNIKIFYVLFVLLHIVFENVWWWWWKRHKIHTIHEKPTDKMKIKMKKWMNMNDGCGLGEMHSILFGINFNKNISESKIILHVQS